MFKRYRKLMVVGVMIFSLVAVSGHFANLWAPQYPAFSGSWYDWSSIIANNILKFIANVDKNKVAVEVRLTNLRTTLECVNPAFNSTTAQGEPYTFDDLITGSETLTTDNIIKNGKALSDITFTDEYVFNELFPCLDGSDTCDFIERANINDVCVNPNWHLIEPQFNEIGSATEGFTIEGFDGLALLWWDQDGIYEDDDTTELPAIGMKLTDIDSARCTLNATGDGWDCVPCDGKDPNPIAGNIGDYLFLADYSQFEDFLWSGCVPPPVF